MKEITFANEQRAREVALSMNKESAYIENNETRGSTYHRWIFSENSVVVDFAHGHGNKDGRFTRMWLVKGTAHKVGRDETNLDLAGVSAGRIMLLTGHKTEEAFFRYIRINKEENAKILSEHAFFK